MNRKRSRSQRRLMYRLLNALFFAVFAAVIIIACTDNNQSSPIIASAAASAQSTPQLVDLVYQQPEAQTSEPVPAPTEAEPEPSRYESISLSDEDMVLLAKIVWLEARGESFEGQQAVAEVVFNRMLSEYFPDTLSEVIYQKGQFSTAGMVHTADPENTQYLAIEAALNGPNILPREVVFFATTAENDNVWGTIGGHTFCYPWFWDGE